MLVDLPPAAVSAAGQAEGMGKGCLASGEAVRAMRPGEWWVGTAASGYPADSDSVSHATGALRSIRRHEPCLRELADAKRRRWKWSASRHLARGPENAAKGRMIFVDLGCRWGDQVAMFVATYPNGSQFEVWCFEPSPRFHDQQTGERKYVPKFTKSQRALQTWMISHGKMDRKGVVSQPGPGQVMHFVPMAAGVANTTARLTDNSVGSSIVSGRGNVTKDKKAVGHVDVVRVIDFPGWLAKHATLDDFVVLKMDIESMEFPILHRMCASMRVALVDELLLECHFGHRGIARDDVARDADRRASQWHCMQIVHELRERAGLTALLWTDLKSKHLKTYSRFRNGFVPT